MSDGAWLLAIISIALFSLSIALAKLANGYREQRDAYMRVAQDLQARWLALLEEKEKASDDNRRDNLALR